MSKTITIFGATGVQGGGVVDVLLKEGKWKIRAVTRNTASEKAKILVSKGCEVVAANLEQPESLAKAIEGTHAVFAVTNFWEYISEHGPKRAGEIEHGQGVALAKAASESPTLEHYVWSTLPSAAEATEGKLYIDHLEGKKQVDDYIMNNLPELAKKTTFLWVGYYATNMAWFGPLKPQRLDDGQYIYIQPCPPWTRLPIVGDAAVNTGIFVRQILNKPEVSLPARYMSAQNDNFSHGHCLDLWRKVTGKKVTYLQCSQEEFNTLYPVWGKELAAQWVWNEAVPDWSIPGMVSAQSLGILPDELITFEQCLENLKSAWD